MSIAKKELPERFEPTPPNSIMNYPNNKIRSKFSIQINLIRSILKQQIDIKSEHISNGETTVHGTYNSYEEMLNKTKILIEDIQDIAFESIKVR
ncbi:hypothetical protein G9F31_00010 [Acinetobacter sp. 187]|uniref:hypothetical protein n=1 Tax=Acinetobacter lanii TaxID=2715163 RepID=UPI001407A661|nr:hypothetical protein [Acinetobacter lanii]NHC02170.1 hypothetical protein [Acinetobacter lanii]